MNYFLIFCSGFTFAIGGINFVIGITGKNIKPYLYFGILSLAASIFLLAQIPTMLFSNYPDLSNTISIISASTFYSLILWFVGEFTNYRIRNIQISITSIIVLLLISYFFLDSIGRFNLVWNVLAHLTICIIGIYGIMGGFKGKNNISNLWLYTYLFLMLLLSFLAILVGTGSVLNKQIIPDPAGFISLLDFFPVFFSIIIGYKMSHDVIRSYQLEKEIQQKDIQWSALMETVNLLIVELDLRGDVLWVNSYFIDFTNYSENEIIGKNWFDIMLNRDEKRTVKETFGKITSGEKVSVYQNHIITKGGQQKSIQWSNIPLRNTEGSLKGTLSIGADVTERENALLEIKKLKDQLEKENLILKEEISWNDYGGEIIGESDALKYVIKRAYQVSGTNSSVLLEGETGVGKELFANLIHRNSMRRHSPFVKVNCAALPKVLIESELFGHEKGAFTGAIKSRQGRFELADKGTIFLDEIGELPLELQPKLLRALQAGEFERIGSEKTLKVDVRIITATNRNLEKESSQGKFRKDLYFRLNVYPITVPPLRQRKEDIPILIRHFTNKIGQKVGKRIKHISKADIKMLQEYDWPGNVRELENVIERAIINSSEEKLLIDQDQLKSTINIDSHSRWETPLATLDDTQKDIINSTLEACKWKINGKEGAAQKLGLPPSTLRSKMKKLGIARPKQIRS